MVKQKILDIDPAERIITEIKRHPIGEYVIYLVAGLGVLCSLIIMFMAANTDEFLNVEISKPSALLFGVGLILFILLFGYAGSVVYRSNELIVTDENLIQILQFSLFNKQVSQLNLAKIQDVSVDQKGYIPHYFNYGTLMIETAGEAANFKFIYTPNPNRNAKIIIEAHEDFIRKHGVRRGTI